MHDVVLGETQKAIIRLLDRGVTDLGDLAEKLRIGPGQVRTKLRRLMRYGLVTADSDFGARRFTLVPEHAPTAKAAVPNGGSVRSRQTYARTTSGVRTPEATAIHPEPKRTIPTPAPVRAYPEYAGLFADRQPHSVGEIASKLGLKLMQAASLLSSMRRHGSIVELANERGYAPLAEKKYALRSAANTNGWPMTDPGTQAREAVGAVRREQPLVPGRRRQSYVPLDPNDTDDMDAWETLRAPMTCEDVAASLGWPVARAFVKLCRLKQGGAVVEDEEFWARKDDAWRIGLAIADRAAKSTATREPLPPDAITRTEKEPPIMSAPPTQREAAQAATIPPGPRGRATPPVLPIGPVIVRGRRYESVRDAAFAMAIPEASVVMQIERGLSGWQWAKGAAEPAGKEAALPVSPDVAKGTIRQPSAGRTPMAAAKPPKQASAHHDAGSDRQTPRKVISHPKQHAHRTSAKAAARISKQPEKPKLQVNKESALPGPRAVVIGGRRYESIATASREVGLSADTIRRRLADGVKGFREARGSAR